MNNVKFPLKLLFLFAWLMVFMFSNISCNLETVKDNEISKATVKKIISEDLNLVFLTAEWCSASKSVLKRTYTKLCDSLKDEVNIVIICASEENNNFKNQLDELGINCPYYLLPNKSSHEKILEHGDRKRIRHFIKNNLTGYKDLDLKWNFGVPVSLFVNKDLKIIEPAPQDYGLIKNFVQEQKK